MTLNGPAPLVALTLALALCVTAAADAAVEEVWSALRAAPWGATYEKWTRPGGAATCERFRGSGSESTADEQWAYRCRRDEAGTVREWFFYVFPGDPPAPRLEQFRARISAPVGTDSAGQAAALAEGHRALAERISERYGAAERPAHSTVNEFGSAYWREIRRWRTDALEILLYVAEPHSRSPHVGLLARHRSLLAALAEDERGVQAWAEQVESPLAAALGNEVRAAYPDYGALLARLREGPIDPATRSKTEAMILALQKAAEARDARSPALLLAADELASYLGCVEDSESAARRRTLGGHGLTWEWSELGGGWIYAHDLLWRVWREYPAGPWGERAFLRLLHLGWDTSGICGKGEDQFREVILQGEAFLARHPASPARADIEFLVAQAYETWWSLAEAPPEDEYVQPEKYRAGAVTARQKAIALYKDVLRLAPSGPEATYARRVLPRLALGFDTGQRRFFCIYD